MSAKPATKEVEFTIRHGDCIRCLKQLDPESVDVVVTSPPYNLGIQYSAYNDKKSHEDYLEWCAQWGCEIARVLKPNGSFFLNLGDSSENPYFAFDVAKGIGQLFHLQNTIHWIKSIHFTPEGKTKLDRLAIGVPYADKTNIDRWSHTNGKDKRCRGNTWFIPYKTIHQRAKQRPHPATFPTELAVKCIRLHGRQGAVVVDPFLGIGHSAFAAKECGDLVSRFIGFDIDEEYIKVACEVLGCDYSQVSQQTS